MDDRLSKLQKSDGIATRVPEHGYHSQIVQRPDSVKWVQVDLGKRQKIKSVLLHACYDDFAGIGAGFGFPKRFKIIASNKEDFSRNQILVDRTKKDFANPRLEPVSFKVNSHARYLRIEATKLAERKNDYILALAELRILDENLENLAMGRKVTAQGQY